MTKQIMVGGVAVGGGAPVTIQSMCNTKTEDAGATIEQILRLKQSATVIAASHDAALIEQADVVVTL